MISLTQNIVKVLPKASLVLRVTEESLTFRNFFFKLVNFYRIQVHAVTR